METSLKTGFAQIFSRCPKNLSCPKFGGAAAPLAPPARTPMSTISLLASLCDPGVCLSNVSITLIGPKSCFMFAVFAFKIKVSIILKMIPWNYQIMKHPPPHPQTVLLFGSEKLLSLLRNRPQYSILRVHNRFNGIRLFSVFGCSGGRTGKGLNSTSNSPLTPLLTELSDFRQSAWSRNERQCKQTVKNSYVPRVMTSLLMSLAFRIDFFDADIKIWET